MCECNAFELPVQSVLADVDTRDRSETMGDRELSDNRMGAESSSRSQAVAEDGERLESWQLLRVQQEVGDVAGAIKLGVAGDNFDIADERMTVREVK